MALQDAIVLKPEDVPGAMLRQDGTSVENHSKLELQRWLECHGLLKTGTKAELVQRVINCFAAGREEIIFIGIDGGKWYDAKRNLKGNAASSSNSSKDEVILTWKRFPTCKIPQYYNKGHIYTYIVGTHFESEEYEARDDTVGITEKPFRRGSQFVSSDHIHDVYDAENTKCYFLKGKCFASFMKNTVYCVEIVVNQLSGAVISGTCQCKQSTLGKCSHVSAMLLFLAKFCEEHGYDNLPSTSKLRDWGLGAKLKTPGPIASKYYPTLRFQPLKRSVFDPRPESYTRSININNFLCDIQMGKEDTMFETLMSLKYEDFHIDDGEMAVLQCNVESFKKNMSDYMNSYGTRIFQIKGAEIQGSDGWKKWRSYFFTASVVKTALSLTTVSAKSNYLKKNLWNITPSYFIPAQQYGIKNEVLARREYINKYLGDGETVAEVGLYANKDLPHLACSADGVVLKNNKINRILEIKCPLVLKNADPNHFETVLTPQQKHSFFLHQENGVIKIKYNHPYLYQVVTSMLVFTVCECDFVVWSKINVLIYKLNIRNVPIRIIEDITVKLRRMYYSMYVPEIFLMKIPRNLPLYELSE